MILVLVQPQHKLIQDTLQFNIFSSHKNFFGLLAGTEQVVTTFYKNNQMLLGNLVPIGGKHGQVNLNPKANCLKKIQKLIKRMQTQSYFGPKVVFALLKISQ